MVDLVGSLLSMLSLRRHGWTIVCHGEPFWAMVALCLLRCAMLASRWPGTGVVEEKQLVGTQPLIIIASTHTKPYWSPLNICEFMLQCMVAALPLAYHNNNRSFVAN